MSEKLDFQQLLDAGVHFGHLKRKWNPNMAPYIFTEKKGIHIIDLNKTLLKLEIAKAAIKQIAKSGKKIMFVATKKQAKAVVEDLVKNTNMPYVVERWPGGMLTNFATIRRAIKKMQSIDKMTADGTIKTLAKRERLQISRQRSKLERLLGSIAGMTRIPSALFIVDINKEHIAVAEAKKLNIPIFAIVDTNTNPKIIDFPIPANDDASKAIAIIVEQMANAVIEGLEERKADKKPHDDDTIEKTIVETTAEASDKVSDKASDKAIIKEPIEENQTTVESEENVK